jgi:hypothetical protein
MEERIGRLGLSKSLGVLGTIAVEKVLMIIKVFLEFRVMVGGLIL